MNIHRGPHWRDRPRSAEETSDPRAIALATAEQPPGESGEHPALLGGEASAAPPQAENSPEASAAPLTRGQNACLLILTLAAVLYGLYSTRAVAFPIVLAVLIALPLRPLVRSLKRVRIPVGAAALLVVMALGGLLLGGSAMLLDPARKWVAEAPKNMREVERKLRAIKGPLAEMEEVSESVERLAGEGEAGAPMQVEVKQPSLTSAVLNTTGNVVVGATITVSLVFLLLAFGDQLLECIVRILPTRGDRRNLRHMTYDAERSISRFLLTYTAINAGLGLVIGSGMWLLGMPNPILWGVMAACLNYIPFLGLAVGTTIVFIVGVITFDSVGYALLAPAIYLAANGIEANIVTPLLLGKSLKLNVIIIFVAIILWGWMWGIGGALIAVPLLIVAKVISDHVQSLRVVSDVLAA